jgi:hypothetical protein
VEGGVLWKKTLVKTKTLPGKGIVASELVVEREREREDKKRRVLC